MDVQVLQDHRPRRHGAKASWARVVREMILDAAQALVENGDASALTPSALAEAVHMRPSSVQRHFETLDLVHDGLTERALAELGELVTSMVGERIGREALQAVVDCHRLYAQARPGMYAASQQPFAVSTSKGDQVRAAYAEAERRALRGYGLTPTQEVNVQWLLRATIRGAIADETCGLPLGPRERDEAFDSLVSLLDAGARSAGARIVPLRKSA